MATSSTRRTYRVLVITTLLLVVGFQRLCAQILYEPVVRYGLLNRSEIRLQYASQIGSNSINKSLIFNDYWTNDLLNNQIDRLRPMARLGFESNTSLSVYLRDTKLKGHRWSPMIQFSQNQLLGLGVDESLMKLFFQGNGPNKQVQIDRESALRQMRWSDVMVGLEHINKAENTRISLGLAYVSVLGDVSGRWTTGEMLTSEEGDSVSIINSTITYKSPSDERAGNGASLFLAYDHVNKDGHQIKFRIQDLGVISWSSYAQYQNAGDVVHEGLIWDVNNQTQIDSAYDSLFDSYYNQTTLSHTYLPMRISAQYNRRFSSTRFGYVRINYRLLPGNLPQADVGMKFKHSSKERFLNLGAFAGGYGMYGAQLGIETQVFKKLFLKLDAQGVESLISERKGLNWSGRGRIQYFL